jgi:hypothetical protein
LVVALEAGGVVDFGGTTGAVPAAVDGVPSASFWQPTIPAVKTTANKDGRDKIQRLTRSSFAGGTRHPVSMIEQDERDRIMH